MSTITRRGMLGAASGAVAAGLSLRARPARAAEFTFKYANNLPVTHPMNIRAQEAVQRIAQESNGRIEIKIFPNSQLGGDTDVLNQLRIGAVDFFTLSGLILATLVPVAAINGVGFAFKSYDQVWPAMDGGLGAHIRGQVAKAGLVAMEKIWDNGYREITTSTRPINSPDDLKGLKIRVPVSPLWTSMFKAFGAGPASMNVAECYTALQTHVVDAQENPLAVIFTTKFYEVQKYCSLTNHMWDGYWMLANRRIWEKLPADMRDLVAKHWNEAAMAERQDVARLNASLQSELQSKGMIFNQPAPEPFHDALRNAGFYAAWKAKLGDEAWSVLEQFSGRLA